MYNLDSLTPFPLHLCSHPWPWFNFYLHIWKAWLHYLVPLLCFGLSHNNYQFIIIICFSLCPPLCPSIE